MKRLVFALVGTAALALAGCHNNNEDAVQNAELNQPDSEQLNDLADQAAADANAEQANLANQQNAVKSENAAAPDNAVNPAEADEQNVSGM